MNNGNEIKQPHSRNKKKGWMTIMRPATLLFIMVLLFSYVSYAWMRREWTPYVEQEGITISTSGSLVFQLDNNQGGTGMSINKILELDDDFVLKPVSNLTGRSEDFFTLNMTGGEGNEKYQHLRPATSGSSSADYTSLGVENGYIEFKMALFSPETNGETRYIYIHPDSHIELNKINPNSNVINCIRVSITLYDQTSAGKTIIFIPDGITAHNVTGYSPAFHSGVNTKQNEDKTYVMDTINYYSNPANKIVATKNGDDYIVIPTQTEVAYLKDYMGGFDTEPDAGSPSENNTLFTLTDNDQVWVTIRIWAEGTHPDCTEEIAGAQINLKLKFGAAVKE